MSIYDQSTTKFVLLAVPRSVSELQRSGEIFTAATLGKLFRKTMRTISISHRHSGSRFGTGQVSNHGARHYQLVFKSRRSADGRGRRGNNISTGLFISAFNDGHDSLVWHLPPLCPDGPCLTDFFNCKNNIVRRFHEKIVGWNASNKSDADFKSGNSVSGKICCVSLFQRGLHLRSRGHHL